MSENGCPPYERIVKNVHPIATKGRGGRRTEEDGDDVCRCTVEQQCGEQSGCLNRSVYVECAEEHGWDAGAGIRLACENRKFTHRKYRQTVPFPTESKGWGLRAEEAIPAGSFIIEYVGEVISLEDSIQRMTEDGDARHHYFMSLNNGSCIDASRKGNRSRFINHSCSPNAVTQKWMVDRKPRIGIFALSDIASGEEITFDYQFENFGMKRQKCHCGHAGCRGVIGGKRPDSIDHSKIYQLSGRIAKLALLEPIVPTLPPVAEQKRLVLSYLSGSPSQRCRFFQHCPVFLLRNLQLLAAVVERQINLMALLHEPDPSGRRSSRALSTGSSSSFSCKSPTLRIRPINVEVSRIWNLHAPPIRISPFSSPSSASSSSIVDYRWLTDLVKAQFVQDSPNPSSRCARPMNTTVTRRRLQRKHTPAQRLVNS
ncbi:MAG: SET domain-containing protein-lysine N-methyltransferase [archaeon]|nr:SET domain-containing protein-lysine N-methyltransferase [archaeon]